MSSIIIMEDQPDISNLMTKTHIGSNTHPVNEIQSGQNYSLQDTILQIPLMEDILENRKETKQPKLPVDDSRKEIENNIPSTSRATTTWHHKLPYYLTQFCVRAHHRHPQPHQTPTGHRTTY